MDIYCLSNDIEKSFKRLHQKANVPIVSIVLNTFLEDSTGQVPVVPNCALYKLFIIWTCLNRILIWILKPIIFYWTNSRTAKILWIFFETILYWLCSTNRSNFWSNKWKYNNNYWFLYKEEIPLLFRFPAKTLLLINSTMAYGVFIMILFS